MCQKQQAPPSAAPQGGGASRRPLGWLLLAYILYDFSHMFSCFSMFSNDFCRKDCFPRPLLSRPRFQDSDFNEIQFYERGKSFLKGLITRGWGGEGTCLAKTQEKMEHQKNI